MKNNTIAYLIQAHNNPDHLFKLVDSLNNKEVSFFIHIDNKVDILEFRNLFLNFDNIYFVEKRVNVIWKWFSQVKATISCMKLAINTEINFKYYILLSWVDYPIKPNNFILSFFKNSNYNYLEFKEIKKSNSYIEYFKNKQFWFKISKWHFYDTIKLNWNSKNGSIKHWLYRFYILFNILIFNNIFKYKNIDNKYKYYFWSSWWSFNEDTVKYILNFYDNNNKFNNIFKFSDAPDEMYFHTIVLNSKFKTICKNDNLRFIDWSDNREWPAILYENDFNKIKKTSKLFARKFWKKSYLLILYIKKYII